MFFNKDIKVLFQTLGDLEKYHSKCNCATAACDCLKKIIIIIVPKQKKGDALCIFILMLISHFQVYGKVLYCNLEFFVLNSTFDLAF